MMRTNMNRTLSVPRTKLGPSLRQQASKLGVAQTEYICAEKGRRAPVSNFAEKNDWRWITFVVIVGMYGSQVS